MKNKFREKFTWNTEEVPLDDPVLKRVGSTSGTRIFKLWRAKTGIRMPTCISTEGPLP